MGLPATRRLIRKAGLVAAYLVFAGAFGLVGAVAVDGALSTDDSLTFVSGDRPVYHLSTGPAGTYERLEWALSDSRPGISVTYGASTGKATPPAVLHIGGYQQNRDRGCPVRIEWAVTVAGGSVASGTTGPDDYAARVETPLVSPYAGERIGISARLADGETCAATFGISDLAVVGGSVIPFMSPDRDGVFLADECRNNQPCPRP